jgi:Ni,Fe-hydrogenase I cytochrome b subunit
MIGFGVLLARLSAAIGHAARRPEFRGLLLVAVSLVATGTAVYSLTENWSVVDGLYFAVSTLTTTSPNGLVLTHDFDKLFTVVYILFGIGVLAEFIRQIAVSYGELKQERRAAKAD